MTLLEDTAKALLLVNLGSPEEPTVPALRRYLNQFLMDKWVLDVPYILRKIIVSWFILPFRPTRSAEAYNAIWLPDGAPLVVYSQAFQKALQEQVPFPVYLAMRYGQPDIVSILKQISTQNPKITKILVAPLYPHYAQATVESVLEKVHESVKQLGLHVEIRPLPPFYSHPGYIQALVLSAKPYLVKPYDHLLFSYHGLPERHLKKADPTHAHCLRSPDCCTHDSPAHATCYRAQILKTTALFAKEAGLKTSYSVSFQSRLGRDKWLEPSTESEIARLAKEGCHHLVVICPAFLIDCLETLEEIGLRGKEIFIQNGGTTFTVIPCLNSHPEWVSQFSTLISLEGYTSFNRELPGQ